MGRPAKGWRLSWRGDVAYVRFTYRGQEYFLSTGERDPGKAPAECARLYAHVIEHGAPRRSAVALSLQPLDVLFADWLDWTEGILDVTTSTTYGGYASKHFIPRFTNLAATTQLAQVREYIVARLKGGLRSTVQKEVSALRGFLTWCRDTGIVGELPAWVVLDTRELFPSKAKGVRVGTQRQHANILTPAQVEDFLSSLPEWSERRDRKGKGTYYPVRARFVVAYETGLRPATLDELLFSDVTREGIAIRDESDKARFGRLVPITERARAALEGVGAPGLVFGKHDYRTAIRKACIKAGIDLRVAPYDFRHTRGTHLADAGAPLTAIGFLHGHTQATTTNKYVRATERSARAWVDAGSDSRAESVQTMACLVRRTGVEPVQELPRWNLNPAACAESSQKQACWLPELRLASAEIRTLRDRTRALHGFRAASHAWLLRSAA